MIDVFTRAASFQPASFDEKQNTVEVVFSAGSEVVRSDYEGQFIECLDMSPAAVNLGQVRGAPVLDGHDRYSVKSVLGTIEAAKVDGTRGTATIRFGTRPEIAGLVQDIRGGIIRNVSVGYSVQRWEISKRADGLRVKTAVAWTPKEISFTPLGADPKATTRSKEESMNPQEQYRNIAEAVGVPAAFADALAQRSAPLTEARAAIIAEAARLSPPIDNRPPAQVTRETSPADYARAAGEALVARLKPRHEVPEIGRPLVGRRISDVAREMLRFRGESTLGSDAEIIDRSLNTTSDLANIVGVFANKTLAAAYQAAPPGIRVVCKQASVADFKGKTIVRRGELPTLEKVNEHGEFKRGSLIDGREGYSIDTYGKVFGMSRRLLINDDLGALSDITAGWGWAANEFENQLLVNVLTANSGYGPAMTDTLNLFNAGHSNVTMSADFNDSTMTAARYGLRMAKGLDGTTPINAVPKYIVVPAKLERVALSYLASTYPATPAEVNTWAGNQLTLIIDPRLDAKSETRWYMFADPAVLPVLEFSYLSGYEGVQVETRNGFDVDGVEVRARLDFGAGGVDFRGAHCVYGSAS